MDEDGRVQLPLPGVKIRVDDIKNLVDVGYDTETALAAAFKDSFDKILPNRPGVVYTFSQPAGMLPY